MATAPDSKMNNIPGPVLWVLCFFIYWFGSPRFDINDPDGWAEEDVLSYLAEKGFVSSQHRRTTAFRLKKQFHKKMALTGVTSTQATDPSQLHVGGASPRSGANSNAVSETGFRQENVEVRGDVVTQKIRVQQRPPKFIFLQGTTCMICWFFMALGDWIDRPAGGPFITRRAGIETLFPNGTDLRLVGPLCEDLRPEIWRWWTYQFTHIGAVHTVAVVFMLVLFGVPLEAYFGFWLMLLLFNVGVVGGALTYFWCDAHTIVVGSRGGVYALIGVHIMDILLNFRNKRFKIPSLLFILVVVALDMLCFYYSVAYEHFSYSTSLGGFIFGIAQGTMVAKPFSNSRLNMVVQAVIVEIVLGLGIFGVWWWTSHFPPTNFWEERSGESMGGCWVRAIFDPQVDVLNWLCVRCQSEACIKLYNTAQAVMEVDVATCITRGWHFDER